MDALQGIGQYMDKMVNDRKVDGMKVLLLDAETMKIISMVYSQSEILDKDVFLVELLGQSQNHERMTHMKAIVFIRPIRENLALLKREMEDPKYGEYHLFFSNAVQSSYLETLAMQDTLEIVRQVHEYYADYLACTAESFHLNVKTENVQREAEGVLSLCLSLKKKPVVRYQMGCSSHALDIATKVQEGVESDTVFEFRGDKIAPVLLILDRCEDAITPLLSQWSYQAMVHELLGLHENRIDMSKAPGIRKDLKEIVLSTKNDSFFLQHRNDNFGDICLAVKGLVDEYQQKTKTHESIQSIEDMQRFVENYPAFRSQSLNVSKHVALMGELARLVEQQDLMNISQLEQEMVSTEDHTTHYKELLRLIESGKTRPSHKIRLALIYALRYEHHAANKIGNVKRLLRDYGIPSEKIQLMDAILEYGGEKNRRGDLFGDKGIKKYMKAVTQGLQGVPNVYAQHVPPLLRTIEMLSRGQLSETRFPLLATQGTVSKEKPRDIFVYVTGGITYEEVEKISEFNSKNAGTNVIIGGSYMHNSTTFMQSLRKNDAISIDMNDEWNDNIHSL